MVDTAGGSGTGAAPLAGPLVHLYAAMYYLAAIIDATNTGSVARAGRVAQRELWAAIEGLNGSREDYTIWAGQRDEAFGVARSVRRG